MHWIKKVERITIFKISMNKIENKLLDWKYIFIQNDFSLNWNYQAIRNIKLYEYQIASNWTASIALTVGWV